MARIKFGKSKKGDIVLAGRMPGNGMKIGHDPEVDARSKEIARRIRERTLKMRKERGSA